MNNSHSSIATWPSDAYSQSLRARIRRRSVRPHVRVHSALALHRRRDSCRRSFPDDISRAMHFSAKVSPSTLDHLRCNFFIYACCILSSLSLLTAQCNDQCLVQTSPGTSFRGLLNQSVLTADVKFCSFLGVRYGRASRFGKPVAEPLREGIYNAISDGSQCLQLDKSFQAVGDEDCLFLNVFVPHTATAEIQPALKPVLVYIHGGAFFEGSSSSGEISPDYLIEHDVILVTINYRLHVFGFLNLGLPECGGNMGLRDQTLALEWVKQNIKSFGGDPNRVTVMGQSAGAISTHLLTLSPQSAGLVHGAIMHSAISSVLVKNTTKSYSIKYAQHAGYKGDKEDEGAILTFLRKASPAELMQGFLTLLLDLIKNDDTFHASSQPFWPSEDAHIEDSFFPESLEQSSWRLRTRQIPVMAGQTDMDGTIGFYQSDVPVILKYLQKHVDLFMKIYAKDKVVNEAVIGEIKKYYFHSNKSENELVAAIKLMEDFGFYKFYEQNFYRSRAVYNYQFCYNGTFQYYKEKYLTKKYASSVSGVSHTEDLNYLFYSRNFFPNLTLTPSDEKVIREMSYWWTNFVKTGNPNSNRDGVDVDWKPTTPKQRYYLRIDETSRLHAEEINEDRLKFWRNLPVKNRNIVYASQVNVS